MPMNTLDLLSATTAEITNLDHISQAQDTTNQQCADGSPMSPPRAMLRQPSLLSSSSEQQNSVEDLNPSSIYQINFDVEHLGKNKPQSKRMAVWKYGLPRVTASADGHTLACHEAMLTWSTHSGKYTISVDGEDVFTSVAKGSVLEHKWKWSHSRGCVVEDDEDGNHDQEEDEEEVVPMRIIACRKPPTRSSKDFRCYEFIIGGKVFRDLPVTGSDRNREGGYENEERMMYDDGKLTSILDIIEPGWKADGFA
eukprot:CAMPEP_0183715644 /NCGR_PEP_ID=MMETSP0737-20130205/9785_1 /TAXON_ID=385413 /ORGANISM="Thalassiosira miniscula, Strain CCMP1093" /LENGTH=252 /DNA_ID=CAMNT_0025944761 /DNA_START=309 /DNA_END=1067 /DNA_ORIENTATION=+